MNLRYAEILLGVLSHPLSHPSLIINMVGTLSKAKFRTVSQKFNIYNVSAVKCGCFHSTSPSGDLFCNIWPI